MALLESANRTLSEGDTKRLCCGRLRDAVAGDEVGLFKNAVNGLRVSTILPAPDGSIKEGAVYLRCPYCDGKMTNRRFGIVNLPMALSGDSLVEIDGVDEPAEPYVPPEEEKTEPEPAPEAAPEPEPEITEAPAEEVPVDENPVNEENKEEGGLVDEEAVANEPGLVEEDKGE